MKTLELISSYVNCSSFLETGECFKKLRATSEICFNLPLPFRDKPNLKLATTLVQCSLLMYCTYYCVILQLTIKIFFVEIIVALDYVTVKVCILNFVRYSFGVNGLFPMVMIVSEIEEKCSLFFHRHEILLDEIFGYRYDG